jgi:hypothetical protein
MRGQIRGQIEEKGYGWQAGQRLTRSRELPSI